MNVLFVGDVTGPRAVAFLLDCLPMLRARHALDMVVVDADNADVTGPSPFGGSGLAPGTRDRLLDAGVDVITLGGHAFDGPEAAATLAHPRVLRAVNLDPARPGQGVVTVEVGGEPVSVAVIAGRRAFDDATDPWPAWQGLAGRGEVEGTVLVHYLEGNNYEPRLLAHALDGQVAAVLGTWAHVATDDLTVLPGGTAVVGDVGYTGPLGGIGGFDPEHFVAGFTGADTSALPPYRLMDTAVRLDSVVLDTCEGVCRAASRVRLTSPIEVEVGVPQLARPMATRNGISIESPPAPVAHRRV